MNNFEPKISIVINNYNYEKYVGVAIQSALDQTYKNIEIIVVDDGSTDGSIEIIKRYENIKSILKDNGGQASALNIGFSASHGDVVIFLDSDDMLYPTLCKKIADNFNNDISLYQYKLGICNESGYATGEELPDVDLLKDNHFDFMLKYGHIPSAPMSGVAYSREYLNKLFPFDLSIWNNATDGYMIYIAPIFGKVFSFNECFGMYRVHSASLSQHGALTLKKERQMLMMHVEYSKGISKYLSLVNKKEISPNKLLGPYHWKRRIISFLVDKKTHPFVRDSISFLAVNCIKNFFIWPNISLSKKIKNILFIFILKIFPLWFSRKIVIKFCNYSDIKC